MKPTWVMTEEEKKEKKQKALQKRMELRRKIKKGQEVLDDIIKKELLEAEVKVERDTDEDPLPEIQDLIKEEALDPVPSTSSSSTTYPLMPSRKYPDGSLIESNLVMPFTVEETRVVEDLVMREHMSKLHIPLKPEVLLKFVESAKTGKTIPYQVLVDGHKTCLRRIVSFINSLDSFSSLYWKDRQNLINTNSHLVVRNSFNPYIDCSLKLQVKCNC